MSLTAAKPVLTSDRQAENLPSATEKRSSDAKLTLHESIRQSTDDLSPLTSHKSLGRNGLQTLARAIDLGVLYLVCGFGLASFGAHILALPLGTALPYLVFPALLAWALASSGAYSFSFSEPVLKQIGRVAIVAPLLAAALFVMALFFDLGGNAVTIFGVMAISAAALLSLHAHYATTLKRMTRSGLLSENVVIVGATPNARKLIEQNAGNRELNIVAIFDDRLGRAPREIHGVQVVGTLDDLLAWNDLPRVDRIIVTVTSKAQERVKLLIEKLRYLPNRVVLLLDLEDFNPEGASLAQVANSPAAYVSGAPQDARRAAVKQVFDLVLATLMLVAFAPLMAVLACLIKLDSRGPVFFRQKRHGFNNQIVRVWKFRTMRPDRLAEEGIIRQVVGDDDRVTRLGRFLRRSSLDELPQLFNVIKGEMSLVGPRPHAVGMTTEETEVHKLVGDYAHRHRVKPGLTGWAQINGSRGPVHTAAEVRERVRLDMEYVNRSSLWFDLYIMIMTAPCLLGDRSNAR